MQIRRPQVRRAGVLRKNGSKRIVYSKNSLVKNSRGSGAGAENPFSRSPRGMRPARAGSLGSHFWAFPARTGANVVTSSRFRVQKRCIERDLGYSVGSKEGFWGPRRVRFARAGSLGSHFSAFPARTGTKVLTGGRFRVQKSRIERDFWYLIRSKRGFWGRRKWPQASRIRRPQGPACGDAKKERV